MGWWAWCLYQIGVKSKFKGLGHDSVVEHVASMCEAPAYRLLLHTFHLVKGRGKAEKLGIDHVLAAQRGEVTAEEGILSEEYGP